MNKVERYSNWCEVDRLDGEELKHGEYLEVYWPDGSITVSKVVLETRSYTISDHGHPYDVPVRLAFVEDSYRGQLTRIPLVGVQARRVEGLLRSAR